MEGKIALVLGGEMILDEAADLMGELVARVDLPPLQLGVLHDAGDQHVDDHLLDGAVLLLNGGAQHAPKGDAAAVMRLNGPGQRQGDDWSVPGGIARRWNMIMTGAAAAWGAHSGANAFTTRRIKVQHSPLLMGVAAD